MDRCERTYAGAGLIAVAALLEEEEMEGGAGSGTTQEAVPSSAPPPFPEIGELDLENDPVLMDALWLVIINAKGSRDSA